VLGGPKMFFLTMGITGAVAFLCTLLLIEPSRAHMIKHVPITVEEPELELAGSAIEPA